MTWVLQNSLFSVCCFFFYDFITVVSPTTKLNSPLLAVATDVSTIKPDRWFIWSLCQQPAGCCVSRAAPSKKELCVCRTDDGEVVSSANARQKAALASCDETALLSEARRTTGKGRTSAKEQHGAVSSRQSAPSVFSGSGRSTLPAAVDYGPRACFLFYSAGRRPTWRSGPEGPNQTHKSCCSFSFTRRTSRLLPFRGETSALVTVSCLSQSTFLLSFGATLLLSFCFFCAALVCVWIFHPDRRPIHRYC